MAGDKKKPYQTHWEPDHVFPDVASKYSAITKRELPRRYFLDWLRGSYVPGAEKIGGKYWIRKDTWKIKASENQWGWIQNAIYERSQELTKRAQAKKSGIYLEPKRMRGGKQNAPRRRCPFFKVHREEPLQVRRRWEEETPPLQVEAPSYRVCRTVEKRRPYDSFADGVRQYSHNRNRGTIYDMRPQVRGPVKVKLILRNAGFHFFVVKKKNLDVLPGYYIDKELLTRVFSAFNWRDVHSFLALLSENISWSTEDGRIVGKGAVRKYLEACWAARDDRIEMLTLVNRGAGKSNVKVRQTVKDLESGVLSHTEQWHMYTIVNDRIERMEISSEPAR